MAAALGIADRSGLAAVSMRAVGRELGVEAMSLYHHVANKDALLDAMVDAVFTEFHDPRFGEDWEQEMRRRSRTAREAIKRHPWALGLMNSRRGAGLETIVHHDAVIGCLRSAGFSLALTGHPFAALDAHLYGFLVQELSLPFDTGDDLADLADLAQSILGSLPEGELPHFREFALEHALQPGYDFGDEFDVTLDLVIEGLRARLAPFPAFVRDVDVVTEPVSYGWLAERIAEPGEALLPARLMGQVLTHLRDQGGTWSWSPRLTAFVVSAETGEPGVGYFVPELADAAAIREQTHRRVASGVYDSGA